MAGRIGVGPNDLNNDIRAVDGARVLGVGANDFNAPDRTDEGVTEIPSPTFSMGDTATPPVTPAVPGTMSAPSVTSGNAQVSVTRAAAPSTGGSPITGYNLRYGTDQQNWTTVAMPAATQVVTGLTNGTNYFFQTQAVNAVGGAPWSASASTTPMSVATAPAQMAAPTMTAGNGSASAQRAAAPSDGGSAITSYDLRYGTDQVNWTVINGIGTTANITGLVNGTLYYVQTRAVNAIGPGAYSPSANVTPVAAGASLLTLSEPMAIGGNSYDAQSGNINTWLFALIESEGRGLGGMGFLQARGGDRLTHLLDRIKPMKSQRSLRPFVMNVENDFGAGGGVTDTDAGGEVLKSRLDAIRTELVGVRPAARLAVALNAATTGARGKPVAFARYKALVQADAAYDALDEGAVFDPTLASQSTDGVHPSTVVSARAIGRQRGQWLKSVYVADPMMPANGQMPTNMMAAPFNTATNWTLTSTSPGLAIAQSDGFLRDIPSKAAHIFTVSGTATQDETLSTTAPDTQLRLTIPLAATDTFAKVIASLMRMEIRSVAGGAPIGLATIQVNNGFGQSFNKQHVAAQGYLWDAAFSGLVPVLPAQMIGQTAAVSFDLRFRGKLNVAADFEIRIADLNLPQMDTVALGAPAFTGYKFTTDSTNRPILGIVPTTTPAAGSTVSVGATVAINNPGTVVGGNTAAAARTWQVLRDGGVVGTMTPVLRTAAAVPYTVVSADAGKVLEIRQTVDNGLGTDTFVIGTITVNP